LFNVYQAGYSRKSQVVLEGGCLTNLGKAFGNGAQVAAVEVRNEGSDAKRNGEKSYITMERSTIFNGKTHYFDWAIFSIYVKLPEGT